MRTSDSAYHKAARAEHKSNGDKELRVWLSPTRQAQLSQIQKSNGDISLQKAVELCIWKAFQEIE